MEHRELTWHSVVLRSLGLILFAWAAAGLVLWIVEVARQGYVGHRHFHLLLWSGAAVYRSLAIKFLAVGLLLTLIFLAIRALPLRRRAPVLLLIIIAAALAALLWFGYRLNRYTLIAFWKEVRNTRSMPPAPMTLRALGGNFLLLVAVAFHAWILVRSGRFLVGLEKVGTRPHRSRLTFLLLILIAPAAAFALSFFVRPAPLEKTNLLVIALDTTRQDHIAAAGYPKATTPVIDRLVREGSFFSHTISQAPWTLSSFSSLLTGLYPSTHGAYIGSEIRMLSRDHVPCLPKRISTLAEMLKERGYATACEATNTYLRFGLEQGYDHWRVKLCPAEEAADRMLAWLEENGDRPFFAFLHFNDAHIPNRPPDPFDRLFPTSTGRPHRNEEIWEWKYTDGKSEGNAELAEFREHKIAVYDGCIRYMDSQIGRVIAWLDEKDLARKTVVAVISDHGEEFWEHASLQAENYRDPRGLYGVGHGHTLFEEQLRLLLVLRGPDLPEGRVISDRVRAIDFVPTLLDLVRVGKPAGLEGKSLLPMIGGGERGDRPALAEAVVFGSDRKAIVRDGFKYIDSPDEPDMLFNLAVDPEEQVNLIDVEPERVAAMRAESDAWRRLHEGKGPEAAGTIDEATLEELKSLGYIQD